MALSTEVSAGESWRHPFGLYFFNIADFYHYALKHSIKNFPHHRVGSHKSVSNRACTSKHGPALWTPRSVPALPTFVRTGRLPRALSQIGRQKGQKKHRRGSGSDEHTSKTE